MNPTQDDPNAWREEPEDAPTVSTALIVTAVRIVTTDPPRYELDVDDLVVTCSLHEIIDRNAFQARCLAVLHRIPSVPSGKGSPQKWQRMVNAWLAGADRIAAPEEASPKMYERSAVLECIEGLSVVSADTEGASSDFRRGCVCFRAPRAFLRLRPLMTRLRAEFPKMGPDDLAEHLRALRWVPARVRLGAEPEYAWYADRTIWEGMPWRVQIEELTQTDSL